MSENKKMSSPYAILDNRPLDQWKVTELKEELKRRKLMTKGLKEDLVKRLDEVIRAEMEENKKNVDNGFDNIPEPDVESNKQTLIPPVSERTMDTGITEGMNVRLDNESMTEKLDSENRDAEMGNRGAELGNKDAEMDTDRTQVDDSLQPSGEDTVLERQSIAGTESTVVEELQVVEEISVDTSVTVSETIVTELASSGQELPTIEIQNQNEVSDSLLEDVKSKSLHEEAKLNSSDFSNQVDVVSQVRSDSISIDTISITEKNELKDNVIADDVKLELDVKPEMAQSSFSNDVLDSGKPQADNVGEPHEDKVICGDKDFNSVESVDIDKKNDSGDVGSSEKLNLDRSSGDDSMEEDASESKQIDSKLVSDEVGVRNEKLEASIVMEDGPVDAMVEDIPAEKKIVSIEKRNDLVVPLAKRKLHDQEAPSNSETTKRQRRWNSEGLKVPESQNANHSASNTPKDAIPSAAKRSFSRSDSTVSEEVPKERIVPPSPKPPTNSLRIDHFLRPFTLKAVQELLGRTGTVVSFWMDHIKTHCYVTYSSVEEAIETRNAVYNLQWPANGGRLLLAEFVDPQDVKVRVEAPVQSPATTPVGTARTLPPPPAASNLQPPQPSPRLPVQRQQLPPPPPLPLPPPPPLSNPPPVKERALPPPPPLPEKVEPPIVTLDDLFRKTKATPRIYYLPLSDEQVAAKLKAQGKNAKQ